MVELYIHSPIRLHDGGAYLIESKMVELNIHSLMRLHDGGAYLIGLKWWS
jgi:hypothetical protein